MAITREGLKKAGVPDECIDEIMRQHNSTLADYIHKDEISGEVKKALNGVDIQELTARADKAETLEKELANTKREYAINEFLKGKGVKGTGALKAARSLFDLEKITLDGDTLKGMDDQYSEVIKDTSVSAIFGVEPSNDGNSPPPPQFSGTGGDGMAPKGSNSMPDAEKIAAIFKK